MGGIGRELKAQLFLEGRSIPFQSASVQFKEGAPATATFKLPPLREINDILPRTMTHLFVKDFTFPGATKPWVLLFEGEVYGYGLGKNAGSRSFNIMCMDISNYWDNAKQFYMNIRTSFGDQNSTMSQTKNASEAKKENTQIIPTSTGVRAYLTTLVSAQLNAGKDMLTAVVEILKGIENVNPFFRYANARYRINDRLVLKSSGQIQELFDFQRKDGLWDALAGKGNGGITTVRQIVNMLMGLIFHDFVSIPAPSKVDSKLIQGGKLSEDGIGPNGDKTIGTFLFKPNSFMLAPPKCNILFPDQYDTFSFNRNFFHEVTRTKFIPSLTSVERVANRQEAFQPIYYAPSGYNEFRTGNKGETVGTAQAAPVPQGKHQDKQDDLRNTSVLQDFNFLSHEEILKGIFSDQGNIMPSAQIVSQIVKRKEQFKFYQRATDFLFFKKRLASRGAQASGPLNISPVPGFTTLLIDDSDAEQHVMGTLNTITHQISPTQGGYTQYGISFARYVEEKDLWDGGLSEPPIPSWFDEDTFGKRRALSDDDFKFLPKQLQDRVKGLKFVNDFGNSDLKNFYVGLLGDTRAGFNFGSEPITTKKFPNVIAATLKMVDRYRAAKIAGREVEFINVQTRRDYVLMTELFQFLGADIKTFQRDADFKDTEDVVFSGQKFDGGFVDRADDSENSRDQALKDLFGKEATSKRREILTRYRNRLFTEDGFRG